MFTWWVRASLAGHVFALVGLVCICSHRRQVGRAARGAELCWHPAARSGLPSIFNAFRERLHLMLPSCGRCEKHARWSPTLTDSTFGTHLLPFQWRSVPRTTSTTLLCLIIYTSSAFYGSRNHTGILSSSQRSRGGYLSFLSTWIICFWSGRGTGQNNTFFHRNDHSKKETAVLGSYVPVWGVKLYFLVLFSR